MLKPALTADLDVIGRFKHIRHDDAESFIEAVLPDPEDEKIYVYRGVKDIEYRLTPSALRGLWYWREATMQVNAEYALLHHFVNALNEIGIPSPDGRSNGEIFEQTDFLVGHPSHYPVRLATMAQHHGVPTRLLDWSYDPRSALWFAIREGMWHSLQHPSTRVCVWMLDTDDVDRTPAHRLPSKNDSNPRFGTRRDLWLIDVPRSTSPFLKAQQGCFTIRSPLLADEPDGYERWWIGDIDQTLPSPSRDGANEDAEHEVHSLPVNQAHRAADLLSSRFGMSDLSILPDIATCASVAVTRTLGGLEVDPDQTVPMDGGAFLGISEEAKRRGDVRNESDVMTIARALLGLLHDPRTRDAAAKLLDRKLPPRLP